MSSVSVPVVELNASIIDDLLSHEESQQVLDVIQSIGDSLTKWGFVSITGHGLSTELLEEAYQVARQVFSLSETQKCSYEDALGGRQRGYTPLLMERAKGQSVSDLKEFWHIGRELAEDHPHRLSGLMRPNRFPSEFPRFKEVMLKLYKDMDEIAHVMLKVIERYLEVDPGRISRLAQDGNSVLRVLNYPDLNDLAPAPGSVRAAAHEDINLLTLLPAATHPGLQLLTHTGEWLDINPPAGSLILDTGDMMNAITGGRMPATTHRVINPPEQVRGARLSMPFFMHPRPDAILESLLEPLTGGGAEVTEGVGMTAQAFLDRRLSENGLI